MNTQTDNAGKTKVTALPGDGIGPEVMQATMTILKAAGAPIEWETAEAGAEVFKRVSSPVCRAKRWTPSRATGWR